MTVTPTSPPCETLAEGLRQALDALRAFGSLASALGEQTTLTSRYTLAVKSAAEVDGIAAEMDVKPDWTMPWTYQATWTEGTVTVTVTFSTDPCTAPLNAATIDSIRYMAAGDAGRGAA